MSGTDQQQFQNDQQQFDQQRSPQQQLPLQQQFGVSPRFDNQQQTQERREVQPGGSLDLNREQGSSFERSGQSQGQNGSNMQSGPGSSGGGQGGTGGTGGSGGSGGSGGGL